jgi:predicted DNA-binding protein YlxM (UPF0122 family)
MSSPEADPIGISEEFIEESKRLKLGTTRQGGPYSTGQRRKRRQEVFKLHFEQGLPAIKIADLMKINRNTINDDIRWLYTEMVNDIEGREFDGYFAKQLVRLETQRARLFAYLSDAKELDQKLAIERQLADMDFRLASMIEKFKQSQLAFWDEVSKKVNQLAESNNIDGRFTSVFELYKISVASRKSLDKLRDGVATADEEEEMNSQ